jgi:dTDP-glucose 4,6-dehydratase
MRLLVTGGAGFIGSAFCLDAIAAGDTLLVVDALSTGADLRSLAPVADHPAFAFLTADIRDPDAMAGAMADFRPEAVVHLAAETHVDRSIDDAADFVSTNVVGTQVVLDAALGYWRGLPKAGKSALLVLHVSTDEVFGELGPAGAFDEDSPFRPNSPYAASKAGGDHLAMAWARTYGLPVMVANPTNTYGPRQFPEKLIPAVIARAFDRRPVPVYGDGRNVRDWLHVDDHVVALRRILAAGRPGRRYCVGARQEMANIDLVRVLLALVDARLGGPSRAELIDFVADRPGHDRRYAVDPSLMETELGWRAAIALDDGLARTVDWYLANEDWWRPHLA